ncbi:DUF3085 domain-containing protein [Streptomyces sp. NPDC055722]
MPSTPSTPETSGTPETLPSHPDKIKELLELPSSQRPEWLNKIVGDQPLPPIPDDSSNPLLDIVMATTHRQDCTLTFPLAEVFAAAKHAVTAPKHRLAYDDDLDGVEPHPQLWWVKDDGTYLMSNGTHPDDKRGPNGRLPHVVYADNWGSGTDPRSILGGDDFSHPIDLLTRENDDAPTVLDVLRDGIAAGDTRFLLKITHDEEGMLLSMSTTE